MSSATSACTPRTAVACSRPGSVERRRSGCQPSGSGSFATPLVRPMRGPASAPARGAPRSEHPARATRRARRRPPPRRPSPRPPAAAPRSRARARVVEVRPGPRLVERRRRSSGCGVTRRGDGSDAGASGSGAGAAGEGGSGAGAATTAGGARACAAVVRRGLASGAGSAGTSASTSCAGAGPESRVTAGAGAFAGARGAVASPPAPADATASSAARKAAIGSSLIRAGHRSHAGGHTAGSVVPGSRHASRRRGARPSRMTIRTYFPTAPSLDTRIVRRVLARRNRSSGAMRPGLNDRRRRGHDAPLQRTLTVAEAGALTRSRLMRAPPRNSAPLTRTTGNGRR